MDGLREALASHIYNNYDMFDDEGNNCLDPQIANTLAYEFMIDFLIDEFDKNFDKGYRTDLRKKRRD